jgi:hypothetical protein
MITPTAQAFFDHLPTIEALVKPITAQEAYRLMEGHVHPDTRGYIGYGMRKTLPEYLPDIGKDSDKDQDGPPF